MKAIILFIYAVAISGAAIAQAPFHQTTMKEGVMKKEGKMWYIKAFRDSMLLDNDIHIYANGLYKTTDGKTFKLKDGGRLDYEGAVEGMDQRIDEGGGMIVMNNGFLWVWSVLNKPMLLTNGNYVMPDGTLRVSTTHKYVTIEDKTFIDFDGNLSSQQW
jgi:hypothetical protein